MGGAGCPVGVVPGVLALESAGGQGWLLTWPALRSEVLQGAASQGDWLRGPGCHGTWAPRAPGTSSVLLVGRARFCVLWSKGFGSWNGCVPTGRGGTVPDTARCGVWVVLKLLVACSRVGLGPKMSLSSPMGSESRVWG